jgi:prophage antirepressor-like protein
MQDIIKYEFEGKTVRTVMVNGEPHWVAKDVCEVLELTDVSMSLRKLDDDEKGTSIVGTLGGPQEMATVNQPGLFKLIMRSRKPAAKRFDRWVRHEVLPPIFKTGAYIAPGSDANLVTSQTNATLRQLVEIQEIQQRAVRILSANVQAITSQLQAVTEWQKSADRTHPFGTYGKRDAKILRGVIVSIRDKWMRLGTPGSPLVVYRKVDDSIRKEVNYRNETGASWANAPRSKGEEAMAAATRLVAAADRDLVRKGKEKSVEEAKSQTVIQFPFGNQGGTK